MLSPRERLLRNLDWNLLYTFLTIVDESSITGAARKLSLSQPSVSNALKRLEDHLGMRLILRKKGMFSLTYQGLRVYEYATSAGNIISHMAEQFAEDEGSVQGEISIQIASHIYSPSFDQTLAQYHALYPKVLITINTQPSADIVSAVAKGKLHIGLSNKKTAQTGLRFDLLGYEQMAFYCSRGHSLFGKQNLKLDDLSGLSYVSFESDQPGEGLNEVAKLRAEQQCWGKLVAVSSNEEEVRRLILAGVGFGALTVEGARPFVEMGILYQLPPYDDLPVNDVYLVTPENIPLTEVEKLFVAMLRKNVEKSVREIYFK
ncbi:LysR family transcriptional regulator [Amphritea balenae]|uniref:LysR family transcriptional regulator n=1 Tax=Amphritea balenae TaxID=452629 RepID=A0A3P1SWY7_9GAMM|nr:LysR family transcriptional regulator [Amphritea balenae]RRD01568.1 LysR family transcriptional regulator [Amphritea balenae]GGK55845.1 LysR family transcriptional regulator [Amphritea balenae]